VLLFLQAPVDFCAMPSAASMRAPNVVVRVVVESGYRPDPLLFSTRMRIDAWQ
jgi:hypothetical protein